MEFSSYPGFKIKEYFSHYTELTCTIPCPGMFYKLKLGKDLRNPTQFNYLIKTSKGYLRLQWRCSLPVRKSLTSSWTARKAYLMPALTFYSSSGSKTDCNRENYRATEPLVHTSITPKLVSLYPCVTALIASQQNCWHSATSGSARAGSLHVVRKFLSQSHRSRSFYSSRHLNEKKQVNLYIPDSSLNLNYGVYEPCAH